MEEEILVNVEEDEEEVATVSDDILYVGGTDDYNSLSNKPKINDIELTGNKSLNDLGIDIYVNGYIEEHRNELKGNNGQDGANGIDGINGTNGVDGQDGRGITSVLKTNTVDNIDTYTITFTDNTTTTFEVTNGTDGTDGTDGVDGVDGVDGIDGQDLINQGETVTVVDGTVSKQLQPNIVCLFNGTVSSLTITLPTTINFYDEYNFIFTTSSTGCNLSIPASVSWDGETVPTLEASKIYEVSILNNVAMISKGISA